MKKPLPEIPTYLKNAKLFVSGTFREGVIIYLAAIWGDKYWWFYLNENYDCWTSLREIAVAEIETYLLPPIVNKDES